MRPQILTALIFTVLGAVSASPLAPRNGCQPNFEGAGVSVVNPSSGLEWAIISEPTELQGALLVSRAVTKAAEFRFEHTGAPSNPYLIKFVDLQFSQVL